MDGLGYQVLSGVGQYDGREFIAVDAGGTGGEMYTVDIAPSQVHPIDARFKISKIHNPPNFCASSCKNNITKFYLTSWSFIMENALYFSYILDKQIKCAYFVDQDILFNGLCCIWS